MQLKGKTKDIVPKLLDLDRDKIYVVDIKEFKEKRSLNANAYYWKLVNEISNVLRASKEEIHFTMLKRYGQRDYFSCLAKVNIEDYGIRYYECENTYIVKNQEFKSYIVYKGSSEMDTREMSVLIDGVVSEAKELEIETLPPDEIKRIKEAWIRE